MGIFSKTFFYYITCLLILSLLITTGCTNQVDDKDDSDKKWDYAPMVSKENYLYHTTGTVKETLSDDHIFLGKIEKRVPQTEAMKKGKNYFIANAQEVGEKVYGYDKLGKTIYVEGSDGSFYQYER